MKKREINIDEFTPKDIEELKSENIDLRVKCSKLLNDNFLLHSQNIQLENKVKKLEDKLLKYEQHD